jgi:hypothetical protein
VTLVDQAGVSDPDNPTDAVAQYELALDYMQGRNGRIIDPYAVKTWLEKAAAQGHDMSQTYLGIHSLKEYETYRNNDAISPKKRQAYFDEGIGLRHMIDYYYLLEKAHQEKISLSETVDKLGKLGLLNFAKAVMYIMHQVLGMDKDHLIVPMDSKRGEALLDEILLGGNFGKYSGLTEHSIGMKNLLKYRRTFHFIRKYPGEAFCEPIFRTWHYFYRLR